MRVFLGGTVEGYDWREYVMSELDQFGIEYFNPVVKNYTEQDRIKEDNEKEICDILLFTITNDIVGVYSIAEVTEYAVRRERTVIFCNMYQRNQSEDAIKMGRSLANTERLISKYTAMVCHDLHTAVDYIRGVDAAVKRAVNTGIAE